MRTDTQTHSTVHRAGSPRRPIGLFGGAALAVVGAATLIINLGTPAAFAAEAPINLRTTASYSVLGGETVTNTGPTVLDGDLGTSPGTAITGFPPGITGGATRVAAAAAGAKSDLTLAYDEAAGRATTQNVAGDLVGRTLVGGVYTSAGPLSLSGTVTLDAQGDPNAVFIFQAASSLITATSSRVALLNGASSCNVYWQVGESAVIGTGTRFTGTIMALTSISVGTNARVDGRALARNGAVTLDSNVFQSTTCVTAPITTVPPTDTGSGTPTDGGTGGPGTGTPTDGGTGGPGTGTPTDGGPGTPGNSGTPGTPGDGTGTPTAGVPTNPAGNNTPGPSSTLPGGGRGGNDYDALANSGTDAPTNAWIGVTALALVIGGLGLAGTSLRRREKANSTR